MKDETEIPELVIGDYSITQQSDGNYWIYHKSGEGMQTTPQKLGRLIHDFYTKEF